MKINNSTSSKSEKKNSEPFLGIEQARLSLKNTIFEEAIEEKYQEGFLSDISEEEVNRKLTIFSSIFSSLCEKNSSNLKSFFIVHIEKQQFTLENRNKEKNKRFSYTIHLDKVKRYALLKIGNHPFRIIPWTLDEVRVKKIMEEGLIELFKRAYNTNNY